VDSNRQALARSDPAVWAAIVGEEDRERRGVELIPSENYTYPEVFAANGSVLTNKYAEGYPGRRYYGGQEFTDAVERIAIERACKVFRAEHANVQALSGSPMKMADVSHIGGLIAGNAMANPLDHGFDVMTTTGHKTLRGPRSGLILSRAEHRRKIDKAVFPGLQGGPHMNAVAALAITLGKALEPEFAVYARQVLTNAQVLAEELMNRGAELVTGGTENHMMVLDTRKSFDIDGRVAEETLDKVSITVNKQLIPDDPLPPLRPSGIRLGSPAATTRGMEEAEMKLLAEWIVDALRRHGDDERLDAMRQDIERFCLRFPVPGVSGAAAGTAARRL